MNTYISHRRAFTIVEILVSVSIIGLILAIAGVNLEHSQAAGRDANRETSVKIYQQALELNRIETGSYFVDAHSSGTCAPAHSSTALATDDWHLTVQCVGRLGHSIGRMTRKGTDLTGYNPTTSIADALVQDGYLDAVRSDPLATSYTAADSVTKDFYLTLCTHDGHQATNANDAKEYAIRAQLEVSASTTTKNNEQHSCGGASTTTDSFDFSN